MLLAVAPLGLPFENTWFSGFIAGVGTMGFFVAGVVSMPEPKEDSSVAYIWLYRFGHAALHLGTSYFAHPTLWRYFKDPRGERHTDESASESESQPARHPHQQHRGEK